MTINHIHLVHTARECVAMLDAGPGVNGVTHVASINGGLAEANPALFQAFLALVKDAVAALNAKLAADAGPVEVQVHPHGQASPAQGEELLKAARSISAFPLLVEAVEANHKWHQDYDDYGGYPGSELEAQNLAAIALAKASAA